MFLAQSTTRGYIRAEGDLHKKIYMVERAIRTETDSRTEKKEWASSVYFKGINHNIPTTWRWTCGDTFYKLMKSSLMLMTDQCACVCQVFVAGLGVHINVLDCYFLIPQAKAKKSTRRCGECTACHIKQDCGRCDFCKVLIFVYLFISPFSL